MDVETITLFGGLILTADEARRAIRTYANADIIWEWRSTLEDDSVCVGHADTDAAARDLIYHAGVALPTDAGVSRPMIGHGATPIAALEDLLWKLAVTALLDDDPAPSHGLAGASALEG